MQSNLTKLSYYQGKKKKENYTHTRMHKHARTQRELKRVKIKKTKQARILKDEANVLQLKCGIRKL